MKRFWLATNNLPHRAATSTASHNRFSFSIIKTVILLIALAASVNVHAQTDADKQAAYQKTVTERVIKIINVLELKDSSQYQRVLYAVVNQYFNVNTIHEENKAAIDAIKAQGLSKEQGDAAIKTQEEKKSVKLLQQHASFITLLNQQLPDSQVEKIKDGMTYSVFPNTYAAYMDMLPNLTTEQKDKIFNWLKEARELAMDAESADKKHAVFGKYKGRINNYLSAAGYDMKKEGEEWQKRIKEREQKSKTK